ncbi:MAG: cysteine desulfurase [Ignavibacteria bacterium]|nr:cysteine desulfurase [Bacteroidota bacterium]MSQ45964.1 cysteine desulfurase [Ignavibacteria bacterium]
MKPIYLDYSSTTPIAEEVQIIMNKNLNDSFGNPSSIHSFGRISKVLIEEARQTIASTIDAESSEIIFTSGGTESDNHSLIGTAFASKRKSGKNHFIISSIEHHAVIHSAEYLKSLGFEYSVVNVTSTGLIDLEKLKKLIKPETFLISVMYVNNEVGTIQNISEIGKICKESRILFHTDAVQAYGKIKISVKELPIDLMSITAHKIYGPKGVGAIYIRKGTEIDSLIHGGSQERGKRAGTENLPLIVGFAEASKLAYSKLEIENIRIANLKKELLILIKPISEVIIQNSFVGNSVPNIVNISFDSTKINIDGEALLLNLDLEGFALSSGSACSSGSVQASHVLLAMGRDEKTALATLRISIGRYTTIEELKEFVSALLLIVERIKK